MTDLEAIKILEEGEWWDCLVLEKLANGTAWEELDGALDAAISALQEREERSKGCDGCAFFRLRPCNGCSRAYQKDLYEPLKGADHD